MTGSLTRAHLIRRWYRRNWQTLNTIGIALALLACVAFPIFVLWVEMPK